MVRQITKVAGYTALAIAATPFVFAAYTFTLGAAWAFKHPKTTVAGILCAGALMYGASKIDIEELASTAIDQHRTQQIATTQRNNSLLEQQVTLLEQERRLLAQDPQRPIQYHTKNDSSTNYLVGAGLLGVGAGLGLGVLGTSLYSRRNNQAITQRNYSPIRRETRNNPQRTNQPRREPRIINATNHQPTNNVPRRIQHIQ